MRKLTKREVEILRWTAQGKSSEEIANLLHLSVNTINYHIKKSIAKLDAPNKTAAAVKAAVLGLLN
ncbi:MAG: LuxR C-terminal-related transcriptional regulator [Limnohabitans sp.]